MPSAYMKQILTTAAIVAALAAGSVQAKPTLGYAPGYAPGSYGPAHYGRMGPGTARRADVDGPAARLKQGMDKLMGFLRQEQRPAKPVLARFLNEEIAPYFDFDYMAKMAAGPTYRAMSDGQKAKMTVKLKQNFLTTLATRLAGYDNQSVRYLSQRMNRDGRTGSASVAIQGQKGYPARLDFRFYKSDEGWKVYDVRANNQSAVAYYRREFREMMQGPRPAPRGYVRQMMPSYHR